MKEFLRDQPIGRLASQRRPVWPRGLAVIRAAAAHEHSVRALADIVEATTRGQRYRPSHRRQAHA